VALTPHALLPCSFSSLRDLATPGAAPLPSLRRAHGSAPPAWSVDPREADKFARLADQWWDPAGPFRPLHQLNPVRCRFIRAALCDAFGRDPAGAAPLRGLRVLDVGCGGGLLSEGLARMGAQVEGIDVNEAGLAAAAAHAALDPGLAGQLAYRAATVEAVVAEGAQYDAVVASEVIEHVDSVPEFAAALVDAAAPGGAVVVSTISRTPAAYALAVVAAERVLRWVPRGTHDWSRFLRPEEVAMAVGARGGVSLEQVAGMAFDPLRGTWALSRDTSVNYIAAFRKDAVAA
jgi:ubiquinone biosynthesis O-methyltransferase